MEGMFYSRFAYRKYVLYKACSSRCSYQQGFPRGLHGLIILSYAHSTGP